MHKLSIILLFVLFTFSAQASEQTKEQKLDALFSALHLDKMLDGMYDQMINMTPSMQKSLKLKDSEMVMSKKFSEQVMKSVKSQMSWKKMKPALIKVYTKNYTAKEIDDMTAFYQSETGKSMVKKMPAVMKDSMMISQKMMMDMLPKLKEMSETFKKQLEVARNKSKTVKK